MGSERYCLRWNNHQNNLLSVFSQLLHDELLVDVTLACEGHSLRAHKVILSACSTFFQELFVRHPDEHPIVILKDVKFGELRTLLEFMYKGEVSVEYEQLSTLLHTAETLRVKGLVDMSASEHASLHRMRRSRSRSRSPPDMPLDLGTPKRPGSPPSPKPMMLPPVLLAEHNRDSLPTSDSEPDDIDVISQPFLRMI
jgi:BTB/POZ domain